MFAFVDAQATGGEQHFDESNCVIVLNSFKWFRNIVTNLFD